MLDFRNIIMFRYFRKSVPNFASRRRYSNLGAFEVILFGAMALVFTLIFWPASEAKRLEIAEEYFKEIVKGKNQDPKHFSLRSISASPFKWSYSFVSDLDNAEIIIVFGDYDFFLQAFMGKLHEVQEGTDKNIKHP